MPAVTPDGVEQGEPAVPRAVPSRPGRVDELVGEALHPAVDAHVINRDTRSASNSSTSRYPPAWGFLNLVKQRLRGRFA
jgi:hypothetical protein